MGLAATLAAATLGPAVAALRLVLLGDTAAPAWHEARRELPYLFVRLGRHGRRAGPARGHARAGGPRLARLAVLGAATELTAEWRLDRRLGPVAEPYRTGKSGP